MLQERFFKHDKIKLNYVEGPENGPVFLLLPAYDNRWQSYFSIIPKLAANTHLYALDTRGRGRSERISGEYKLRHSLEDSVAFIEEVIKKPCNIFGHNNGGWIGLWLAAEYPNLVDSLIVGDSDLDVDRIIEECKFEAERAFNRMLMDWAGRPIDELFEIFSTKYPNKPLEFIEMRALTFNQVDPEVYVDWVDGRLDRYFEGYCKEAVLRAIKCPTLVLRAENGMISWEEVLWAREVNKALKIKEMDGVDHWLGIQDSKESAVLSEIINFLYSF